MNLPTYHRGNRIVSGSTTSGKSTAEIIDIVSAALLGVMAVIVIDPHPNSLAWKSFIQLVGRGLTRRVIFDRLSNLSRVVGFRFLRASSAEGHQRAAEDEQTIREFIDVLLRRRDIASLATHPLTEEFVTDACELVLHQPAESPASEIQFAFQIHHPRFRQLIQTCTNENTRHKFQAIADGRIKQGQYGPAHRLIRGVCSSPAFTLRCHPSFDSTAFFDRCGILLIESSSDGISSDTGSTIMGAIILLVIQYVRSRRRPWPRVLLVIDEATNANLIGAAGHEVRAMAELQKRGLDVHVLTQSPSFPNAFVEDGIFTNCIEHHWYFAAHDAVARKAAQDLGDPEYRHRVRDLRRGERFVKRLNRVTFERVVPLPDPWAFGLSEAKARHALAEILKRPEYWSPSWNPTSSMNEPISASESSNSPTSTSAPSDTSCPISPAARLRTERSRGSEKNGDCDASAMS